MSGAWKQQQQYLFWRKYDGRFQRKSETSRQKIDCEQSLFFFRFSKGVDARASGEAARRAKRGWQPEKRKQQQKKSPDRGRPFSLALRVVSLFSCLSHLSVTRVAICVSRVLLVGLQKKERLLVV